MSERRTSGSPGRRERAVAFAPGRVNLIGEHTDYNEGLALPFAITEGVTVRAAATGEPRIEALALDLGEDDARTRALDSGRVRALLDGREVVQVIVRPPRLVNVVTRGSN